MFVGKGNNSCMVSGFIARRPWFAFTDKMEEANFVWTQLKVNESLMLTGIPAECFEYRLGNRSALDWVIDQYQVSTDKRSGITSDPNRDDDEEYIVRLVGRVVTVSVETVKLVQALPAVIEAVLPLPLGSSTSM